MLPSQLILFIESAFNIDCPNRKVAESSSILLPPQFFLAVGVLAANPSLLARSPDGVKISARRTRFPLPTAVNEDADYRPR
jgi:hypothetical protein